MCLSVDVSYEEIMLDRGLVTWHHTAKMSLGPYIDIARPSHWTKNVFLVPGILLAMFFKELAFADLPLVSILIGFVSACLVASSNYVLNEILDAETDKFHPDKKERPIPSGRVSIPLAYAEYIILGVVGLALAYLVSKALLASVLFLWIMGGLYNVPPIRLKDKPYFDVVSESVNNPIRLAIGWYATGLTEHPTLSAIFAYWMFGAFLMAVKRFAEYRHIDNKSQAENYRKSFKHYNEEYLQMSILFYVCLFGMFSGVFIARYRMELILAVPMVGVAISQYLHVGYKENSPVQHPEKLYKDKKLMMVVGLAFLLCVFLLLYDIPALGELFAPAIEAP